MNFPKGQIATLAAAIDTVIPQDDWPAGWSGGVEKLFNEHSNDFLAEALPNLLKACEILQAKALEDFKLDFVALSADQQSKVFGNALSGESERAELDALLNLAYQGYYGGTSEPAGWSMVGFKPIKSQDPTSGLINGIPVGELSDHYDAIVIGAGGGGGVVACELSEAGKKVLLLERSRPMADVELQGNHLQGKRQELYNPIAGAGAGSPRVIESPDGSTRVAKGEGNGSDYGLVAMTVGGGTRLWQGMSWRFLNEDFNMATTYGVPDLSTLADWPFGYKELEPYYNRIENELGVAGDAQSPISQRVERSQPYPMPAMPSDPMREHLGAAADKLKWPHGPIPFSINSVPNQGRPACVRCHQCVGNACPVDAKNGTQNTFLPRALATGNCHLLTSAQATQIVHNGAGKASGVAFALEINGEIVRKTVSASVIVVCAGAIETPRLLKVSGLGNEWVGRNYHSHGFAAAIALEAPRVKTWDGPGHSVGSLQWLHNNKQAWGGGVLFDAPAMYPIAVAPIGRFAADSAWGPAHKKWMRDLGPTFGTMSMVQEIPHANNLVSADPKVKDRFGMPVARLRMNAHPATVEATRFMAERAREWIEAAGGKKVSVIQIPGGGAGGEHGAGSARLASSPENGACDERGLLFGTANVYVADASLHPTNGGFNPGMTALANAMRVANLLLES
jgi:choline dehydrogenase-like flavoprotein